jgi:hypothetical protein
MLSLSQSDVVRLAIHLLRYVLYHPSRKVLLINRALDAQMAYEIDLLQNGKGRSLSECSVELVKTDDLVSGIQFLKDSGFGNIQSDVVRRAINFINDLNKYAKQGWRLCVSHSGNLDSDWLESFELRYPPIFQRLHGEDVAEESSDDVKIDKIASHLIERFGSSSTMKMAERWARLRGESLEEFFRASLELAEKHLAPNFFGGFESSEAISSRLTTSNINFRTIVVFIERTDCFMPLVKALAYQLCHGAKVFIMLGTVERAEARCESILECAKEFSSDPISQDSLYCVSVSGSFIEESGLPYPPFVLLDFDLPILRQGIVWRSEPDNKWKPLLGNHLVNAVKHVGSLIKQAEGKGYSLNMHGSVSYHSVDLF